MSSTQLRGTDAPGRPSLVAGIGRVLTVPGSPGGGLWVFTTVPGQSESCQSAARHGRRRLENREEPDAGVSVCVRVRMCMKE